MPENLSHPDDIAEPTPTPDAAHEPAFSPTLSDEFLQSACSLARGRLSWTPGPGHHAENLPWLKGATAA